MINNKLLKEIEEYCLINNISDVNKEINRILRIGFNVVKYGDTPFNNFNVDVTESKKTIEKLSSIEKEPILQNKNEETTKKRIRIIKNE